MSSKADTLFDFPESLPSQETGWATYIPGRSPAFKMHTSRGLAHAALSGRSYAESYAEYELVDGEWLRRFTYVPTNNCNYCGDEFTKNQYGAYVRIRPLSDGPQWDKLPICRDCYQIQKEQRDGEVRQQYDAYRDHAVLKTRN